MAETKASVKVTKSKEEEESEWRGRVLEELRRISRSLEKIADRVGGFTAP